MKKFLKRLLFATALAVLLFLIAAVVIAGFFQEAVGNKLISEINKQLSTELKVGDFELSLLRGFPNATASLHNVVVTGTFDEDLLEANEMSFRFRLLSLFGSQVKVHSVTIRDGALNVHIDQSGQDNYHIFKPSETDEESNFNISLQKATLENIELIYRDEKLRQEIAMTAEEASFSGELSSKQYNLSSKARLVSSFVDLDGARYFAGKNIGYDANIFVDLSAGQYDFNKVKFFVEDNAFDVTGSIKKEPDHSFFDLTTTAEDANLQSVIALLPAQYLNLLGDFSSRGKFQFQAAVNGRLSARESPVITSTLSLEDGRLTSPRLKEPFKDVSFQAAFSNGPERSARTSFFEISDFKGYLNRELMTLQLKVENMDDPFVDFRTDGALPVGDIYSLLGNPAITGGSGEIEFRNLYVNGFYKDMTSVSNIFAVGMGGEISFDDAMLKINGEKMIIDRGTLLFKDNEMTLENLKLEGAGSEINLMGNAQNVLPVLLADSLNSQEARLVFNAELFSPQMDIGRLKALTDIPFEKGEVETEIFDSLNVKKYAKRERITDFLQGTFIARIDEFTFNKMEGSDFDGKLRIDNSSMRIDGRAKGMDGLFEIDGTVFFQMEPYLEAKVNGERINVKKFFQQTENFGQDFIRSENLEGTLNTKLLIHAYWDSTGHFLNDQLHVWAGIGIQKGALKNIKMLEKFSEYAHVSDLRNVQFADMQNWLEIKDSKVYFPALFIQNNAMNLTISGEQTFDDKIDYSIKVNAGQVIANKFKRSNSKLDPIKAKKDGFFNLYFNIHGTHDDYKFESNKRKVKDMFAKSEIQKRQIRAALIKAFGAPLNMLREPTEWGDEGEVAKWENEDDVEYIEGF